MADKILIDKISKGNRKVFDDLCSELYPALLSYALVFVSRNSAEDIIQDAFFSLWQKREMLREDFPVKTYLYRSVRNGALNYLKHYQCVEDFKNRNYKDIAMHSLAHADVEKNPVLSRLYEGDLRRSINDAIQMLPPRQQEIFRCSYIDGMSNKEISEKLGISVRTVESHMHEALKTLRKNLSSEMLVFFYFLGNLF